MIITNFVCGRTMFAYIAKPKEVKRPALAEIEPEFHKIEASIESSSSSRFIEDEPIPDSPESTESE